jgi:hypothetical protein
MTKILNSKQKLQAIKTDCPKNDKSFYRFSKGFEHLVIRISDLFSISIFDIRICDAIASRSKPRITSCVATVWYVAGYIDEFTLLVTTRTRFRWRVCLQSVPAFCAFPRILHILIPPFLLSMRLQATLWSSPQRAAQDRSTVAEHHRRAQT